MSRQAQRSEATRGELLREARELFAERGYAETALELVAERAGVTKGALYHHFKNKRDLFQAVFEELENELCQKTIMAAAEAGSDVWQGLVAGVRAFLEAAKEPAAQRIVLLEGPSVLGWELWKEIDERYGFGLVRASLQGAMEAGVLAKRPVDPLAYIFLAAISEAALQIARSPDQDAAMEEMSATLIGLLESMRATG